MRWSCSVRPLLLVGPCPALFDPFLGLVLAFLFDCASGPARVYTRLLALFALFLCGPSFMDSAVFIH